MSTDRRQRALSAPDPATVPVDPRRPEHDMVFAAAYAGHLKFFGGDDEPAGTWQEFFSTDVSAQLAVVAVEDVDRFRAGLAAALRPVQDPDPASSAAGLAAALGEVFDRLGTLATRLDQLLVELPAEHPLRATLAGLVRTRLSPMLRSLVGYHRAGVDLAVLDPTLPPADGQVLGRPLRPFAELVQEGLSAHEWAGYADADPADHVGGYGESTLTAVERLNHLATHSLFTAIHETFLAVLARVVDEAGTGVEATYDWNGHQPHYALFLSFLQLLQHARDETNTISARHLAYYYREVLRLDPRPAQPAHAHVLVELAKNVDAHQVAAGTLLRAGKDAAGRDLHVAVDHDLAANRAAVADRRHLHRASDGRILAGSVAEAEDGTWHPFAAAEPAEVGFAIASGHLRLAEGRRTVRVRLEGTGLADAAALPVDLRCELTTAEGWLAQDVATATVEDGALAFGLDLDAVAPPISGYDPAVHGHGFATSLPVLLVTLRHREDAVWSYDRLSAATLTAIRLEVGATGLTSLDLSNDQGPIDPSTPFLAFGAAPLPNSSLVVGSGEVFAKSPAEVTLTLDLMTPPVGHTTTPTLTVDGDEEEPIAFPTTAGEPLVVTLTDPAPANIRLRLGSGFGTDTYPIDLAVAIMDKETPPPPPVLPTVGRLTLDYTAGQELDHVVHVGPFGHVERLLGTEDEVRLLPRFEAGELLLGVRDLHPPQNLSLLCQVVDGTANPSTPKPPDHLRWSYLRGNTWVDLERAAVADGTAGLLASGIVTLAVPADADAEHTLLPAGLHWIRASVASGTDAVCRLRTVAAQALRATSVAGEEGPAAQALPAGTISKPQQPDPAVKKLTQPYDGFGGRPVETDADFAIRASERLRHKDRAIAPWDYERLVLEAFPSVHRVTCLPHTRYEPGDTGVGAYSEQAPGHVTVVPVPDLAVPDPHDPLRPRTSLQVLEEIEQFLARRMSCFATLHVHTPQFEEVRVDLAVRFRDGADEALSVRRVQEEITRFLSPWAFRGDAPPSFGGTVHKSVLVDLVEELPWVDHLADVHLYHRLPGAPGDGPDLEKATASRAVAILVSVPADQHGVHPIPAGTEAPPADCGCGPCGEAVRP